MVKHKTTRFKHSTTRPVTNSMLLGALVTSLFASGCLTADIKPALSASSTESGAMEANAGISIGAAPSSFMGEAGKTIASPFYVYRSRDKKWFPEWREHPWRTTGMTLLYGGVVAVAAGGGGGGGGSSPEPTTTQPSGGGHSDPAPSTPSPSTPSTPVTQPSDGGSSGGFL
jgi:hypothetical protein